MTNIRVLMPVLPVLSDSLEEGPRQFRRPSRYASSPFARHATRPTVMFLSLPPRLVNDSIGDSIGPELMMVMAPTPPEAGGRTRRRPVLLVACQA